jgi:hypothetical protein
MANEILQIYGGVIFLFPIVAMKLVLICCMSFLHVVLCKRHGKCKDI